MSYSNNPILNSPIMGFANHKLILDDEGKPFDYEFLEINATFEKITGLKKENIINKTVRQAIPGIEKTEFDWIGYYGQIALEGGEKEFEQYFVPLDKWYRIYVYSKEKMYFTVMFIDITEQKRAEEELRNNRNMLDQILNSIPQSVFWKDRNSKYLGCNLQFARAVGLEEPCYIVGKTDYDLPWPKEEAEEYLNNDNFVMENNCPKLHIIQPLQKADGSRIWIDTSKIPLADSNGAIYGVLGIFDDITKRKKSEDEQAIITQRLRLANKATNDVIWDWDVINDTQQWNEAGTKVFGWTEIVERTVDAHWWVERVHPDDRVRVHNTFFAVVNNPELDTWNDEYRFLKADGTYAYVLDRGYVLRDEQGIAIRMIGAMLDITERKQAEEALQKNRNLLNATQKLTKVGGWEWDIEKQTMTWTDETYYIHGMMPGELHNGSPEHINRSMSCYSPFDRIIIEDAFRRCANEGKSYDMEFPFTRVDGKQIWIRTIAEAIKEGERIIRVVGNIQDITERKQSEEKLRESEQKFREIIESSWDIHYRQNAITYELDYMSPAVTRVLGYQLEEMLMMKLEDQFKLFHPDDLPQLLDFLNDIIKAEEKGECKIERLFRMLHKSGEFRWINGSYFLTRNTLGEPKFIVGVLKDITERKRAEEALLESEVQHRTILNTAMDGFMLVDNFGHIIEVNEAYCKMSGYSEQEILHRSINYFDDLETTSDTAKHIHKVIEKGEDRFESRHRRKDGSVFDVEVSVQYRLADESKLVVFLRDITERKKAEEALKESGKKYHELSTLLRLLADNMPDMLWAKNLNKEFIFTNKAICNNLLNAKDTQEPIGKTDMFFAQRERNSKPENINWHTFGEICRDSDSITLEEMKPMQFDEFGNVKGKFLFLDVHKAPLFDDEGKLIGVVGSARDVTAAKESEIQLLKLSQAVEQSPAIVVITNIDGTIEYVNPKFTEVTGYSLEEAIGQNPSILKSGEQSAAFYRELWETINAGREWRGEFHNKKKNGELFWEAASVSPIVNSNGKITHFLAVKEDITLRKELEEDLKHQARFRELLMEISSGFINIPLEQVDEAVNRSLKKMAVFVNADRAYTFDYDWENDVCNNTFEWCNNDIHPEIENLQNLPISILKETTEIHKKGEPEYIPDVFALPKGSGRETLESQGIKSFITVPMMKEKSCIGFVGFDSVKKHHHYTENELQLLKIFAQLLANVKMRKEILKQLIISKERAEQSELKLKESQTIAKLGAWELDVDKGIFTFTDNFYKMFHTSADEMGGYQMTINEYAEKFVHPDDIFLVQEETNKALQTDDSNFTNYIEHKIKYFDGGTGYIGVKYFILKDKYGKTIKTYGVNQDITEKKKVEQELLKAKEKAEESDHLKTAFLQNMSHEIRTPLNGILGFSKLLNEEEVTKEEIREYTDIILKSGQRLMETVGNILDISKIDTGLIEITNNKFSLNSLMTEMYSLFSVSASLKNLELKYHITLDNQSSVILSDEMKLNQILTNLINNAIKFTKSGTIDFGYIIKADEIEFYVKDTGVGIPDEFKHRIFKRFAQVDLSLTRGYEGAGLGLSICKGLVEMLGGRMWFESEFGKGSAFYFTIPYSPNDLIKKDETQNIETDTNKAPLTILIVEDDFISFRYLKRILTKYNYILIYAENGKDAVEICKNQTIDLVLMDIRMPVMDGLTATKIIKKFKPELPVIAQSAYASIEEIEKYSKVFDDYITKPYTIHSIIDTINNYIDKINNKNKL